MLSYTVSGISNSLGACLNQFRLSYCRFRTVRLAQPRFVPPNPCKIQQGRATTRVCVAKVDCNTLIEISQSTKFGRTMIPQSVLPE